MPSTAEMPEAEATPCNEGERRFRLTAALQVTGIDARRLRGGGNLLAESILADLAQNVAFAAEAGISGGNVERRAADRRGVADVGVGLARAAGDEVNQGFADGVEGHDVLRWWINARGGCEFLDFLVIIAIPRKPHTALHLLAVQMRTVFVDAPCLRLSVYRYISSCQHLQP